MINEEQVLNNLEIKDGVSSEGIEIEKDPTAEKFEQAILIKEHEQLNMDKMQQENIDNEKMAEIRTLLNSEKLEGYGEQIFSSKEEITDFDTALGELVLNDYPDKIVDQILMHIPEDFSVEDNNFGEIEKSIRIWITESATNAARHISYRQNEEKNILYKIDIFSEILNENDKKYLQIIMKDNGVGIKKENLEKIGMDLFTTINENEEIVSDLHSGGNGRFFVNFKDEIATPRGWEIKIQNRDDGNSGAVTLLRIPLSKKSESL